MIAHLRAQPERVITSIRTRAGESEGRGPDDRAFFVQHVCVRDSLKPATLPLCFVVALMLLAATSLFAQATTSDQAKQQRVLTAMRALAAPYDPSTGRFHGTGWWNSANGITVLVDGSRQLETREFDKMLTGTFEQAQQKHPGFLNEFYDDEGWWALAWADAYALRHDTR